MEGVAVPKESIAPVLRAYARSPEFLDLVEQTRADIRASLAQCSKPFVAFSGGKDSTVMLYLVLQEKPDIMVFHWDYGPYLVPRWLKSEILHNARRLGARDLRVETSGLYLREKRQAVNVLGRVYIGRVIPRLAQEGYDATFVGLRAEESAKRKQRIRTGRRISMLQEFWPLRDWTWRDIWAAIWGWSLPYPSIYDLFCPVVGWDRMRLVTFFDSEMMPRGAGAEGVLLWRFKNPEVPG